MVSGLAGGGAAGDKDVAALSDGAPQRGGLPSRHEAGGDVVLQRADRDGGFADREGRERGDGRQQALEALSRLW